MTSHMTFATAAAVMPVLPSSIEERICPPINRFGFGDASQVRNSVWGRLLLLAAVLQQQGWLPHDCCGALGLPAWQEAKAMTCSDCCLAAAARASSQEPKSWHICILPCQERHASCGSQVGVVVNLDEELAHLCMPCLVWLVPSHLKVRTSKRQRQTPYALRKDQLTSHLQQEFEAFKKFCTQRFFGQQADPIAQVTYEKYGDHIRYGSPWCMFFRYHHWRLPWQWLLAAVHHGAPCQVEQHLMHEQHQHGIELWQCGAGCCLDALRPAELCVLTISNAGPSGSGLLAAAMKQVMLLCPPPP